MFDDLLESTNEKKKTNKGWTVCTFRRSFRRASWES
jgi:hypothetical protein